MKVGDAPNMSNPSDDSNLELNDLFCRKFDNRASVVIVVAMKNWVETGEIQNLTQIPCLYC